MGELKVGFGRVDITPPLGTNLVGYFRKRISDGILDPLMATAVAFSDGEHTAIMMSCDLIGTDQIITARMKDAIFAATGVDRDYLYLAHTHTHLGPATSLSYDVFKDEIVNPIIEKISEAAALAVEDLKPAEMYTNSADTPVDISFIRRFRMKDGRAATNPGWLNPDILHPLGEPDKRVALTYFKRKGAPEVAIINFQVHPDTIGGEKMSADYPGFVRRYYEAVIPNSLCMYINGAQGDTNHVNVKEDENGLRSSYRMAEHMGRTIAGVAMSLYATAEKVEGTPVLANNKKVYVKFNKVFDPDKIAWAKEIKYYYDNGIEDKIQEAMRIADNPRRSEFLSEACRIVNMMNMPDEKELHISGLRVGDFAFVGFPGEPFTDIGRQVKNASEFKMTYIACCCNGYEGYYPMLSAYQEGGYEANTARYVAGTAEKLIDAGKEIVEELYKK